MSGDGGVEETHPPTTHFGNVFSQPASVQGTSSTFGAAFLRLLSQPFRKWRLRPLVLRRARWKVSNVVTLSRAPRRTHSENVAPQTLGQGHLPFSSGSPLGMKSLWSLESLPIVLDKV